MTACMASGATRFRRRPGLWSLTGIAILMTLACLSAWSQQGDAKAAREREMLRRLQAERQQMSSQLQALEAEKARLAGESGKRESDLKALQSEIKKRDGTEKRLRGELSGRVAKVRKELEALEARFADVSTQLAATTAARDTAQSTLQARDAELVALKARLSAQQTVIARQARQLQDARARNGKLVDISRGLLARYQDKGVVDALLQREPFTQLEKVRMQNTLQEIEESIGEQRLEKPEIGG